MKRSVDRWPRRGAGWLLVAAGLLGCGREVPQGGVPRSAAGARTAATAPAEAVDLIPADLDLVVRVDLGKVRRELGADPSRELMSRAVGPAAPEGLVRQALLSADTVWLALRLADLHAGDHVLVTHAARPPVPDPLSWRSQPPQGAEAARFEPRKPPARRGTARILRMGKHHLIFVSPVETMSVERVLRRGPDAERGQPEARGLLSLDYRARGSSVELQDRYPSLAAVVSGVIRVHAAVDVAGRALQLEARIGCKSAAATGKVMRFFDTITSALRESKRYSAIAERLELSRDGSTVSLRWPLSREAALALISDDARPLAPGTEEGADRER